MKYVYFIGAVNWEDVRKKYKKLSLQHHPDRPGGSKEKFQDMQAEYVFIEKKGAFMEYPLQNKKRTTLDDIFGEYTTGASAFEEAIRKAAEQAKKRQYEEAENIARRQREQREKRRRAQEEATRKKYPYTYEESFKSADEMWHKYEEQEPLCEAFMDVINMAYDQGRAVNWMVAEIYKLDNLDKNHFKYIKWKLNKIAEGRGTPPPFTDDWVSQVYKNYVSFKSVKWEF